MDRHALLGGSDDTAAAPRVGPAAHTAARLGAGLATIVTLLLLALLLDPGARGAGAQEPSEGPRLEIESVDADAEGLSVTVTNAGDEVCQAVVGPSGTVSVPSVVAAGTTVEPALSLGQYPDGLEATLPDRLQPLEPGAVLTVDLPALPVAEGRRLSTVSVGPPGTEPVREWIIPAGTEADISLMYGVPTFDGAPDDLCQGTTDVVSATLAAPATERRAGGPDDEDGLRRWLLLGAVTVALVLLVVLVLLLVGERRRRRGHGTGPGPAVATVLAVAIGVSLLAPARTAHAQEGGAFSGPADLVGAAGECVAQYRAAGDPAGILSQLDLSKITLQPKIPGDDTRYDAYGGPGAGFLFWDPTQGGTFVGGEVRTPCTSLYHELFHAVQHKNKQLIVDPCYAGGTDYGIPIKEVEATRAENKLRATVPGLDPRTTYGGDPLPPDGVECKKKDDEEKKKKDDEDDDPSDDGGSAPGGTGSGSGGSGSGSGSGSGDSSSDSAGGPGSGDGTGSGSGGTGSDSGSAGGTGGPTGSSNGDPHLTTLDGLYYDLQTVGEYVALRTTRTGADEDGFEIQVRQEPLPGSRAVSVNTAVGIDLAGDAVAVELAGGAPALRRDGEVQLVTDAIDLPGGGRIEPAAARTGRAIELTWPDGSRAVVSAAGRYGLVLVVELAPERAGTVEGLLGDGDGDPANDLVVDGEPLDGSPDAIDPDDIVGSLADEWRLTEPGLLPYDEGESPETFEDPTFPDAAPPAASPEAQAAAEAVCRASGTEDGPMLAGCALDVLLTGEAGFGAGAAETSAVVGAVTSAVAAGGSGSGPTGGSAITDLPELRDTGEATIGPDTEVRISGEVDSGSTDTFTLRVDGPQVVFVGAADDDGCSSGVARLDIRTPDDVSLASLAACSEPVRVELPEAGAYVMQVSSEDRREYAVVVTGVSDDGDGTIRLGRTITGEIEDDGQQDVYTLEVATGDVLFFEGPMGDDCPDDGTGLGVEARLDVTLALFSVCDDAGRIEIDEGGVLELIVGTFSGSEGTGRYEMTVTEVPDDDQFTLDDGDRVSRDRPGDGAGDIEVPGAYDLYLIDASKGDDLEVVPADGCDADGIRIDLISPAGLTEASALVCEGLDTIDLAESGTYVLRASGVWWTSTTGTYGFRLGLDG